MRRRNFLEATAGALAASSVPGFADELFTAARSGTPGIVEIGSRKELFVDDLLLAEASRISKFVFRPEKYSKNLP